MTAPVRPSRLSARHTGWLLIAATTGMGGLLILWWAAFVAGFVGYEPWTITVKLNHFREQWAEGILFHALAFVVLSAWLKLIKR